MTTSKNCQINLWNEQCWELDAGMLEFVMSRVTRHCTQAKIIDIYPQERVPADAPAYKHPGWLEWIVRIQYQHGGALTLGCIQRSADAQFESHS